MDGIFINACKNLEEALNYERNKKCNAINSQTRIIGNTYIKEELVFIVEIKNEKGIKVMGLDEAKNAFNKLLYEYLKLIIIKKDLV